MVFQTSSNRYELPAAADPFSRMRLLYLTVSRCGSDWHSTPHTHSCLEFFYCLHGSGQFKIDGNLMDVSPNDLVVINPGIEHTELSLGEAPLEYIVLGVEGVEFLFDNDAGKFCCTSSFTDSHEEILFCLNTMLREIEKKDNRYEAVCQSLLKILFIRFLRRTSYSVSATVSRNPSKECALVKKHIDDNFTDPITLDTLAELTHLNKYYLVHSFHREYNISPINYLIERRIRESRQLLSHTDHSLAQISNLLGFSSQSYFSQSFRRLEHMSPGEYRKQNRKK